MFRNFALHTRSKRKERIVLTYSLQEKNGVEEK